MIDPGSPGELADRQAKPSGHGGKTPGICPGPRQRARCRNSGGGTIAAGRDRAS